MSYINSLFNSVFQNSAKSFSRGNYFPIIMDSTIFCETFPFWAETIESILSPFYYRLSGESDCTDPDTDALIEKVLGVLEDNIVDESEKCNWCIYSYCRNIQDVRILYHFIEKLLGSLDLYKRRRDAITMVVCFPDTFIIECDCEELLYLVANKCTNMFIFTNSGIHRRNSMLTSSMSAVSALSSDTKAMDYLRFNEKEAHNTIERYVRSLSEEKQSDLKKRNCIWSSLACDILYKKKDYLFHWAHSAIDSIDTNALFEKEVERINGMGTNRVVPTDGETLIVLSRVFEMIPRVIPNYDPKTADGKSLRMYFEMIWGEEGVDIAEKSLRITLNHMFFRPISGDDMLDVLDTLFSNLSEYGVIDLYHFVINGIKRYIETIDEETAKLEKAYCELLNTVYQEGDDPLDVRLMNFIRAYIGIYNCEWNRNYWTRLGAYIGLEKEYEEYSNRSDNIREKFNKACEEIGRYEYRFNVDDPTVHEMTIPRFLDMPDDSLACQAMRDEYERIADIISPVNRQSDIFDSEKTLDFRYSRVQNVLCAECNIELTMGDYSIVGIQKISEYMTFRRVGKYDGDRKVEVVNV